MLRFRDVQRLDFYVVGQVRFLGRIERDGFGDRLRLLPCRCFRGKQMGIALVPAERFERSMKMAMEFASMQNKAD